MEPLDVRVWIADHLLFAAPSLPSRIQFFLLQNTLEEETWRNQYFISQTRIQQCLIWDLGCHRIEVVTKGNSSIRKEAVKAGIWDSRSCFVGMTTGSLQKVTTWPISSMLYASCHLNHGGKLELDTNSKPAVLSTGSHFLFLPFYHSWNCYPHSLNS